MSAATFRLAVLSDQHIDTATAPASWSLAQAAFAAALRARVDHVVLVGDTFDCATAMLRDREVVERHLRALGLWHRDRLTIVPGNHDMFHTPHHGTRVARCLELARNGLSFDARGLVRSAANTRAFDAWTRPLTRAADRLHDQRTFPLRKVVGHVALYAVDTAPQRTMSCAKGFWRADVDALLRAATPEAAERRVLAIHHPPKRARQTSADDVARAFRTGRLTYPLAFPLKNFRRLSAFLDDASIDAVVCGHIHTTQHYHWAVEGTVTKVPAFMVGRTGGLCRGAPVMGVLGVPRSGAVTWREITL